ncbi:hypothetical protein UFOVP244_44 [uncultured Caudovirales phage]|uniref:Uncharacterized protein n=1 Tax=uncultured Caudovirales phage TaxID=2100421 RepID=A0A6J7WVY9_9CAUD|nr:hypothetical protein UFOVP244_44 [uncultured Caudovirales phage]
MSYYYDRVHRVPVWVVVDLPEKEAGILIDQLLDERLAHYQVWPSKSFVDTIHELGRKGWSHLTGQPKPFNIDPGFLGVAAARHVKNVFGENAVLPGTQEQTYAQGVNRRIEKDRDYEALFNDVLALEQDVSLSHLFGLATPKSSVYVSDATTRKDIVNRITNNTLTVSKNDGTISLKGKKIEEVYAQLKAEIAKALSK